MRKYVLLVLVGLIACGEKSDDTSAVDATPEDDAVEADLVNGQVVHDERCMACHAGNPDMATNTPSLNDAELESVIQNGSGSMPGQGLDETDLRDVIAYLRDVYGG